MRKYLCLLLPLLLLAFTTQAQTGTLATVNLEQKSILRVGMLVLGGWAILNILLASFKLTTTTRAPRYFYQMNLYWNVVNFIIAGFALHQIVSLDIATLLPLESVKQHVWYIKVLYLNVGLDVAYLMLGVYLMQRSKTANLKPEKFLGWGRAIFLQGFFLLLLDVVLVAMLETLAAEFFRLIL